MYRSQDLAIVDKTTGKTVEENIFIIGKELKYIDRGKEYAKVFVTFLVDFLRNKELQKAAPLVLYAVENLNFNKLEVIILPQHAINDLQITPKTFYKWMDILKKHKILIPTDKKHIYKISDYVAVKGSMKKIKEEEKTKREKEQKEKQDGFAKACELAKKLKGGAT